MFEQGPREWCFGKPLIPHLYPRPQYRLIKKSDFIEEALKIKKGRDPWNPPLKGVRTGFKIKSKLLCNRSHIGQSPVSVFNHYHFEIVL